MIYVFSSSLITRILETAVQRGIDFRVIIVDSRPQLHGLTSFFLSFAEKNNDLILRFEICSKIISIECQMHLRTNQCCSIYHLRSLLFNLMIISCICYIENYLGNKSIIRRTWFIG